MRRRGENAMSKRGFLAVALLLAIAIVAAGAYWFLTRVGRDNAVGTHATAETVKYHCPMHPTMVSDKPGDCPICGMRLVPIEDGRAEPAPAPAPVPKK
jgi:hypothetical protein